jgi:GT2 family glycosyltransferase
LDWVLKQGRDEDFVMTINNDVTFREDFFEKMLNRAIREKNAVFNPLTIKGDVNGRIYFSGTRVLSWVLALKRQPYYGQPVSKAQKEGLIEVDYLSGRGSTIPLSAFKKIGCYNQEMLPHYGADEEFTLRAKRYGYRVFIDPDIIITVDQSTTGLNPTDVRLGFRQILRSFSAMNSTNNLRIIFRFARLTAPLYAFPSCLLFSLIKLLAYNMLSFLSIRKPRRV